MAIFTPTLPINDPGTTLDGGGVPPSARVGEDGLPDDGRPSYGTRLRRARLGLVVALTPIVMLFVSFTSAYIVRQGLPTLDPGTNLLVHDWFPVQLPKLLLVNTYLLLFSTATMELARRQIACEAALAPGLSIPGVSPGRAKKIPWLAFTVVLGLSFLTGQWMAWRELAAHGVYVSTTPSSSFVYLLTGMHGLHLIGGVLALLAAGVATLLHRPVGSRSIMVDVSAWYWHFMAILWIYILCLLEFVR